VSGFEHCNLNAESLEVTGRPEFEMITITTIGFGHNI
jgi:hypothetical protein